MRTFTPKCIQSMHLGQDRRSDRAYVGHPPADNVRMGRFDWRDKVIVALIPVAMLVVPLGDRWLKDFGWYLAAMLVVLGAVFGLRAIVLVVVECLALFIVARIGCDSSEECSEVGVFISIIPLLASIPVVAGAIIGAILRSLASTAAKSPQSP